MPRQDGGFALFQSCSGHGYRLLVVGEWTSEWSATACTESVNAPDTSVTSGNPEVTLPSNL